jgi:hypothetical protein
MAMLLTLRGTVWVFSRVAPIAALDWFTTWLPNDNVEGVKGGWANADGSRARRKSKKAAPPKKHFVPYFTDLELKLWK